MGKIQEKQSINIDRAEGNLKIPRQLQLLPYSTADEKSRAEAWLRVSLTEVSRNPMLLVSQSFVYDAEQVVAARQKKEYEEVLTGLESILEDELGVKLGDFEVYDPETPQGWQEEGQVEEEETEEDEEEDEEKDEQPDRKVILVNQEDEEEPENADGDTLSIGAGSTFRLY